jgi:hypothetical protein
VQYFQWFRDFLTADEEDIPDITFFSVVPFIWVCCLWLAFNLHEIMAIPQHDQKVGVWCAV